MFLSGPAVAIGTGESHRFEFPLEQTFRPTRLVANVQARPPDIRAYHRRGRVGGSRRRGRRASHLFGAAMIRHLEGGWNPMVVLEDVRIGAVSQVACASPILLDLFAPVAPPTDLFLGRSGSGDVVDVAVRNLDDRDVVVAMGIAGHLASPPGRARFR